MWFIYIDESRLKTGVYHVLFQVILEKLDKTPFSLLLLGHIPGTCITIISDLEICKRWLFWWYGIHGIKNKIEHWAFYIKIELEVLIHHFKTEIKSYPLHVVCNCSALVICLSFLRCYLEDMLLHNVQIKSY